MQMGLVLLCVSGWVMTSHKKLQNTQNALEYAEEQLLRDRKRRWKPVFQDLKRKVRERQRKAKKQEVLLKRQRRMGIVH